MVNDDKIDQDLMKRNNRSVVFSKIYKHREVTKPQIAQLTGMSVMSAGRIADELISKGLIIEKENSEPLTVGRPPRILAVAVEKLYCASVFIAEEGIFMGLVDPYGTITSRKSFSSDFGEMQAEQAFFIIAEQLKDFLKQNSFYSILNTIGVVLPGLVDVKRGKLRFSAHYKWKNVAVVQLMQEFMPEYHFVVENDVKALALVESKFGAAKDCSSFVLFSIGNGVGAAVVVGGEVYRGKNNMAGEIGHIVLNPNGSMCECGKIGCLQTNLAQWSILQEARSVKPKVEIPDIFIAYAHGEQWAKSLLNRMIEYISIALNLLANVYAPHAIMLCGSLVRDNPELRQLVLNRYQRQLSEYNSNSFKLYFSTIGEDGTLIGGASIAFSFALQKLI